MAGIKETKEMLKFAIELGEGVASALSDGKISLIDAVKFYDAMTAAGPAFADAALIPAEISDLTDEELSELKAYVDEEFDIEADSIETVIEGAFAIVINIAKFLNNFKKA